VESGAEKKTLTPSYLTLTIGGYLKKEIDAYVEYAIEYAIRSGVRRTILRRWRS